MSATTVVPESKFSQILQASQINNVKPTVESTEMPYTEVPNTTDEETKTSDYAIKNEPGTNMPLQFDESLFMDKIKQFNSNSEASSEVGEPSDTNEEPEEFDITQFEEALIED